MMMTWDCCKNKISTPFCPLCGQAERDSPLMELLRYIVSFERSADTLLRKARAGNARPNILKSRECNHKKWKRYEAALVEMMEDNIDLRKIIERQDDKVVPFDQAVGELGLEE